MWHLQVVRSKQHEALGNPVNFLQALSFLHSKGEQLKTASNIIKGRCRSDRQLDDLLQQVFRLLGRSSLVR